ncbi:hypothetical protein [Streptomyces lydicus]|uniref:hypothetical protein n=1 Tax=Streptomyces lydicus TaxID=47763 RepID=UPI0013DDC44A|nr:hypothetical protein [Streptomyces lydicus]
MTFEDAGGLRTRQVADAPSAEAPSMTWGILLHFRRSATAAAAGMLVLGGLASTAHADSTAPSSPAATKTAFQPAAANASSEMHSCKTTGANGYVGVYNFHPPQNRVKIQLSVKDTLADGKSVGVRVLTKARNGAYKAWAWHTASGGQGTWPYWNTYVDATSDRGINFIGVQVARFVGHNVVNSCKSWH